MTSEGPIKDPAQGTDGPNSISVIKQAIIVRRDLKMGRGKAAAQVAHGAIAAMEETRKSHPEMVRQWTQIGQMKVVLQVEGLGALKEIKTACLKTGVPCIEINDAGRTQLPPGTTTVLGIGPWWTREIDKITGDLKLF
ncbi:MAG: peptidyl-tRNA hydrolase Pth2 [Candidatus Hodarchaeota archaeon]